MIHWKLCKPWPTVNKALSPAQKEGGPTDVRLITGNGFTVPNTESEPEQPLTLVTVTV